MLFKLLQLEKVPNRTVTDEGILILESALHPLKVYGNFVKLDDNVTSFKFVQEAYLLLVDYQYYTL